jgi:hypothetical protein
MATATCLTWPHLRAVVVVSDVPCDITPQGTDPSWRVLRTTVAELSTPEGLLAFVDGLEDLGFFGGLPRRHRALHVDTPLGFLGNRGVQRAGMVEWITYADLGHDQTPPNRRVRPWNSRRARSSS